MKNRQKFEPSKKHAPSGQQLKTYSVGDHVTRGDFTLSDSLEV
jgi:hypothetical protein